MTPTFTIVVTLIQLLSSFLRWKERAALVSEVQQVERAKALLAISKSLSEASQISEELSSLSSEGLNKYVEQKGWFRD